VRHPEGVDREELRHKEAGRVICPYCGEVMSVVIHTMPPPLGHCPKCEEKCDDCREFLEAQDLKDVVGMEHNVGISQQVPTVCTPDGSFSNAPGYAAMMAKLKESK
jgi:hypothetical protein